MADILLFHHAQGRTEGLLAFAEELRVAGHTVHTPDLYDGHTFADLDSGVAYAQEKGFGAIGQPYRAEPAALLVERVLAFLRRV